MDYSHRTANDRWKLGLSPVLHDEGQGLWPKNGVFLNVPHRPIAGSIFRNFACLLLWTHSAHRDPRWHKLSKNISVKQIGALKPRLLLKLHPVNADI